MNLAARLEQVNKVFGVSFLVSARVLFSLDESTRKQNLGPLELRRQAKPARLYRLSSPDLAALP